MIPFLPTISRDISKKCLKKCVNFFLNSCICCKNYTDQKLVFQSQLLDDLSKLNNLSHFFQNSNKLEPEMWSVINLDETITEIRKNFRKSYRYLLNKKKNFKYEIIDYKSKKITRIF